MFRTTYWLCSAAVLLLLLFGARSGALLVGAPERGKVEKDPDGNLRGRAAFVWLGGGYHGGWNEDYSARVGKDAGAADDRVGNAIYIVDARTGELVWKAESGTTGAASNTHYEHAGLVDSMPSPVSAMLTPDGVIHRLYVGDTGGAIWRVDLPPGAGGNDNHRMQHWFITKLADLGADAAEPGGSAADDRRFFHAPDIVRSFDASGDFDGVLIQSGDPQRYHEVNEAFHASIYAGSHNSYLAEMTLATRVRVQPFRRAQFRILGRLTKSHEEHDRVVQAILRGDRAAAAAAMQRHIDTVRDEYEHYTKTI